MPMDDRLRLLAPAKINLSLHVRGRRSDGYHVLESLVAFADIGDRLDFEAAEETQLIMSGPFGDALVVDDNLVLRAHAALAAHVGAPLTCHMTLHKNLPIASGIGGGSADAAAALNGLNQFFGLQLGVDILSELAKALGADVPVCLSAGPAWMTGIGHDVTRLANFPQADVVLVNPMQAVSTPEVFKVLGTAFELVSPQPVPTGFGGFDDLLGFLEGQGNTLAAPAQTMVPEIADCLAALSDSGAAFAAMSGSGATCFALAPTGQAMNLAANYRAIRPQDWVQAGTLIGMAAG